MNFTQSGHALRERADAISAAAGRNGPTRFDWLRVLLDAGETCVGGHILRTLAGDVPGLYSRLETAEGESEQLEPDEDFRSSARAEAKQLSHRYVGTEHILLALTGSEDLVARLLAAAGVTHDAVLSALENMKWGSAPG